MFPSSGSVICAAGDSHSATLLASWKQAVRPPEPGCRDISRGWMASARKVYLFTKLARSSIFVLAYIISLFHSFWISLSLFFFRSSSRFHLSLSTHHVQLLTCFPLPLFHSLLLLHVTRTFIGDVSCRLFPWCVSLSLCTSHIACPSQFKGLSCQLLLFQSIYCCSDHQTCADPMNCCHVLLGI